MEEASSRDLGAGDEPLRTSCFPLGLTGEGCTKARPPVQGQVNSPCGPRRPYPETISPRAVSELHTIPRPASA